MKVILSRKGFDSANGGILSPIIDNRIMLSFPIPAKDEKKDLIRYEELICDGIGLDKILHDLGYDSKKNSEYCHLDPDLVSNRRRESVKDWCPAFGQINQAAGYLKNCEVDEGDLFLFFGNFRHVIKNDAGVYQYVKKRSDDNDAYYGRPIQAIWGYLQVGKVVCNPEEIRKLKWHPHSCDERNKESNNTIYLAKDKLTFAPEMPGCGIFDYDKKRVLTMEGKAKATWKYEDAYQWNNLVNTTRKNSAKKGEGIYYSGIWQEIVLADNETTVAWAKSMF